MKKKNGAFGAGQFSLGHLLVADPAPLSFKTPGGGGGGGGGLGGVAYKDRARPPPRAFTTPHHFFLLFDCYIPLFGPPSFTNGAFDSV